jgi:hypothetical protein
MQGVTPCLNPIADGRDRLLRVVRYSLLACALCAAHLAHAQELNPRACVITPVGINVINLGYSHVRYGGNYRTVTASWQYGWFGWPRFH